MCGMNRRMINADREFDRAWSLSVVKEILKCRMGEGSEGGGGM